MIDLTFDAGRDTSVAEVNKIMLKTSAQGPEGYFAVNEAPLVSVDFNHNPASSTFDATQTQHGRNLYAFELVRQRMGFSNRMSDTAVAMMAAD